jgi:hypothetical protein
MASENTVQQGRDSSGYWAGDNEHLQLFAGLIADVIFSHFNHRLCVYRENEKDAENRTDIGTGC